MYLTIFISFFFVFSAIAVMIFTIYYHISKNRDKIVLENSFLIKELQELNKSFKFNNDLKEQYSISYSFNSKYKFDTTSIQSYTCFEISNNIEWYKELISIANRNRKLYQLYTEKYNNIKSYATEEYVNKLKIPFNKFIERERKYYINNKLHPVIDIYLYCQLTYTSPEGRNTYTKNYLFNTDEIQELIEKITIENARRQTIEYKRKMERMKLSNSMRYDVLKRDKFRCVICGASANDGVKLHVDHIIPISKGGKTEMKNLRTLCDRCNLGKSDKIEKLN